MYFITEGSGLTSKKAACMYARDVGCYKQRKNQNLKT
jgi:hypothetical protein